jgi:tetratricopeptide (TPR) repeat protein
LQGFDPAALARRTGVDSTVFQARKLLLEAQLERRTPTLEATFEALVKLDGARELASHDQDIQVAIRNLQASLLAQLANGYQQILGRSDLDRLVEILYYAQQLHPDDPFLNQLMGAAFLRLKRWNDAIPYLERAASERPSDVNYQSNLIFAYERSGRYAEALAALERLEAANRQIPGLDGVKRRIERELAEKGRGP